MHCFVAGQQYIRLLSGEEPGAVSAVSGHHVSVPPGPQDDAELPQHRQGATHHERGDFITIIQAVSAGVFLHLTS